ncbi:WecB/TagA/CpsF family glycosyltransferase [Conyzicola sp.]|uniref:WecB/TagA/CpsF family glycosyltransferase n=1 Tax=Conyzicola sp. TaxID=1969404 RepID=UPI0039891454
MRPETRGDIDDALVISRFDVLSTTPDRLAGRLLEAVDERRRVALFFANTNFVVQCRFLLEAPGEVETVIVNDGLGMDVAAMLVHRRRFAHNLNGTDFTPFLFERAGRPLRVFLLGARPEILERAVEHARTTLGQNVVGSSDGFEGAADSAALGRRINAARPDVVLVAMGNPLQERWIVEHAPHLDASLFIGVGALFDFWAGGKSRAPDAFRRLRIEWLYRLGLEPRRLARRYTIDIAVFLRQCLRDR